jgi:hypothetical protein
MIQAAPAARAGAVFLQRGSGLRELGENDRDIETVCRILCPTGNPG